MAPVTPDLPGLTNLHLLGRGGFADVYRGRQAHLDRFVAAKVFRVTLAERAAAEQFRAECQAVGRLDGHPNLIKVYNADVLPDGRPYLVTEACDISLAALLAQRGPRPADEVVDLGLTLARALLFAHSAGVLHGDVTPQNVLLRATGAPVLADFGLAVLRDYQGNVASGFTLTHAAPETLRYDGAIDERTDVYGLGSTLYAALTGAPPIAPRPGEQDPAHISRILTEAPPRAAGPAWLADLLASMLAKNPAARPSLVGVADTLDAGSGPAAPPAYAPPSDVPGALPQDTRSRYAPPPPGEDTRLRAVPTGPTYAPPSPGQDDTRLRAGTPPPAQEDDRARPRWLVPTAAALVAVLAIGGGLFAFLGTGGEDPTPVPTTSAAPPGQQPTADARIELARPVDNGGTVELTWAAEDPGPLDYAVLIGQPGAAPAVELVGRVTSYTVPVEPGTQYCFQVQGSNQAGTVSESNVQPVRDAVCRFTSS
ncbi:protein kinase [Pseudonocardia sp. RS11V-5]|uniref:protein kinase domain-containing protein n=1 Tax=Pseudonocardia terrae TaxID=2905831 RepID=UPI001E4C9ABC|nr:protein kinase [Pseudonocardia terrae]MCE3552385.1 protein kinase [Pseudonocardia terrae]